jgi:hypothetical protein
MAFEAAAMVVSTLLLWGGGWWWWWLYVEIRRQNTASKYGVKPPQNE